jgi:WD repeat-containing protein 44
VLSIAFHPKDDRFFLAGCKDAKLRLWSIPDKRIEFWVNVGDMITAVGFSPDGKTSLAGTVSGMISLYSTENLKSVGQIAVRGKKKTRITGIDTKCVPATSDALKVLVTTSDSRVRLYNLRDKALELKLKAHKNDELPIRASINDDGRYAICGSEDKGVYIWSLADTNLLPASDRERDKTIQRPLEYFEANSSKTTCAIIAPQETRIFLGQSGDPIYDICNPPPVRLVEREGSVASSTKWNGSASSVNGNGNGNGNGKSQPRSQPAGPSGSPKPERRGGSDTPGTAHSATFPVDNTAAKSSYQARSLHDDGLIVVTASIAGIIRVFRQDCAFRKRKSFDMSIYQSSSRAYLRRALGSSRASISGPPSSARQSSISSYKAHHQPTPSIKGIAGGTVAPLVPLSSQRPDGGRLGTGELTVRAKSRSESISSQPSRDRIERWREDVDGLGASSTSLRRAGSVASTSTTRTNNSPNKQQHHLASAAGLTIASASGSGNTPRSSPRKGKTISLRQVVGETSTVTLDDASSLGRKGSDSETLDRQDLARRSSSYANPLRLQGGQSFMFWNMGQYDQKDNTVEAHDLESDDVDLGPSHTRPSLISQLTDDSKEDDDDEDDDDSDLEGDGGSRNGKCPRCGGMDMKTKESRSWGFGKSKSIVCEGCGLERRHAG